MIENKLHLPPERERERERVNIFVYGNLFLTGKLENTGKIICSAVPENYDLSCSTIIHGDVMIEGNLTCIGSIVVTGTIATKGGCHE